MLKKINRKDGYMVEAKVKYRDDKIVHVYTFDKDRDTLCMYFLLKYMKGIELTNESVNNFEDVHEYFCDMVFDGVWQLGLRGEILTDILITQFKDGSSETFCIDMDKELTPKEISDILSKDL